MIDVPTKKEMRALTVDVLKVLDKHLKRMRDNAAPKIKSDLDSKHALRGISLAASQEGARIMTVFAADLARLHGVVKDEDFKTFFEQLLETVYLPMALQAFHVASDSEVRRMLEGKTD